MSMFSSNIAMGAASIGNMASFQYRPTDAAPLEVEQVEILPEVIEPEVRLTERVLGERLAAERAAGFTDAEWALRQEFERKFELHAGKVSQAIIGFECEQKAYFARVEAEVIQLALAIAGKILHREAQVDPMLLAAIVHLALTQIKEGSGATIRVKPEETNKWREHINSKDLNLTVRIIGDDDLEHGDCFLETESGTVNFSIDAQLKEVQRGFFDVLAQKPKA